MNCLMRVRGMKMAPNNNDLDQKIIERLKKKIIVAENNNLKTKNKTDAQMKNDIKKWIEEEVECCSNR